MADGLPDETQPAAKLVNDVLECFHHNEWHPSLWFPTIQRDVVNFPDGVHDQEVQSCVLDLIRSGLIQVGRWEGAEFRSIEEILLGTIDELRSDPQTEFFLRTKPEVYEEIASAERKRWLEIRNTS